MKIRIESSHELKISGSLENGDTWEASAFIKPHVEVDCPALWGWLKEKLTIQESEERQPET